MWGPWASTPNPQEKGAVRVRDKAAHRQLPSSGDNTDQVVLDGAWKHCDDVAGTEKRDSGLGHETKRDTRAT